MSDVDTRDLKAIFAPVQNAADADDRKSILVSLHAYGEMTYWATAALLATMDTERDWCDGYTTMWSWYCDFIAGNGFARPAESDYATFQRQIRNGRFYLRCKALKIVPELLVSVGPSKAEIIARNTADADAQTIQDALDRATELSRSDVQRLFLVDSRSHNGTSTQPQNGRTDDTADPPAQQVGTTLNASDEPPASAPIPDDDRPHGESRYQCPCGRTHVIVGSVIDHRIEIE